MLRRVSPEHASSLLCTYQQTARLRPLPNSNGILPAAEGVDFPENRTIASNLTVARCDALIRFYELATHHGESLTEKRKRIADFIGLM